MSPMPPRAEPTRLAELDLVIGTPRLRLRPFEPGDVDELWPYVSDPELVKHLTWDAHTDPTQTIAFIERTRTAIDDSTEVAWAIVHAGQLVGCISLLGIRWQLRAWRVDRAEIGYWIAPALRGQGLMTEAVQAVVEFGFDKVGLHKITIGCIASNPASRRVIEKAGFRFIGRLEEDMWRTDRWEATLRYELTVTAWSDITTTMPIGTPLGP